MSFDWADYFTLATELRVRQDEAAMRSAISRLYYAAFHPAKTYLQKIGVEISRYDSSHKKVWDEFRKGRGREFNGVGVNGGRLNDNRKYADYEAEGRDIGDLVESSFNAAKNLFEYLASIERKGI